MSTRNKKILICVKKYLKLFFVVLLFCAITACGNRKEKFKSPDGDNTIIVEYDFVSRPSVRYKHNIIWEYPGRGFNEEVYFDVEWIDNDSFKIIYRDGRHAGKYYEEFTIDLN